MPVRVRCRCGQELVLRHSEWIYLCLGIVILALVVNSVALLLIYTRLDASRGATGSAAAGRAPPAAETGGTAPAAPTASGPPPASSAPAGSERPAAPPAAPAPPPAGDGDAAKKPVSLERPGTPAAPAATSLRPAAASAEDPLRDLLASSTAAPAAPPPPPASTGAAASAAASSLDGPWTRERPFVRFLLLESRASRLGPYAALLDRDPALRDYAIAQLSKPGALAEPPTGAGALASAAAEQAPVPPGLEQVLSGVRAGGGDGKPLDALHDWWGQCTPRLDQQGWRAIRDACKEADERGIDIVLLLDVSQSMEGSLASLQRQAGWLLAAWMWALPQSRLGAVLYKDGVEEVLDLTSRPLEELLPRLASARAEGGGDVPEGVHVAVESALSLGAIHWRPGSLKHLVLLGDAPPPHRETAQLLKLMRLAHLQGGYRLHALTPPPQDGEPAATFLHELARAAGGAAVTLSRPDEIGEAAFALVFPAPAAGVVRPLTANLRDLFAQHAR